MTNARINFLTFSKMFLLHAGVSGLPIVLLLSSCSKIRGCSSKNLVHVVHFMGLSVPNQSTGTDIGSFVISSNAWAPCFVMRSIGQINVGPHMHLGFLALMDRRKPQKSNDTLVQYRWIVRPRRTPPHQISQRREPRSG